MRLALFLIIAAAASTGSLLGQRPAGVPYSSQLRTDPGVGNVQGIQRVGRPLRTDPDEGDGFTFHVFPTVHGGFSGGQRARRGGPAPPPKVQGVKEVTSAGRRQAAVPKPTRPWKPTEKGAVVTVNANDASSDSYLRMIAAVVADPPQEITRDDVVRDPVDLPLSEPEPVLIAPLEIPVQRAVEYDPRRHDAENVEMLTAENDVIEGVVEASEEDASDDEDVGEDTDLESSSSSGESEEDVTKPGTLGRSYTPASLYPPPFDWTSGLRNLGPPADALPYDAGLAGTEMQSGVITRTSSGTTQQQIYQQPLVQIRMRVVEVNRGDSIAVGSILEYVSRANSDSSLTTGQTANGGAENFRSISRFVDTNLITNSTTGTGALVNLTSKHINWLIQGLSTELSADVITAPEVVTLNGQNVEFVAGEKLPFQLGQNVIQGSNNNVQQVFYKHVGTMVSVTPRIVNWGFHGEGQGERSIQANNVVAWPELIDEMINMEKSGHYLFSTDADEESIAALSDAGVPPAIESALVEKQIKLAVENSISEVRRLGEQRQWRLQSGFDNFLIVQHGNQLDVYQTHTFVKPDGTRISDLLSRHDEEQYIPFSVQTEILLALNHYSKRALAALLPLVEKKILDDQWCQACKTWNPDDCTIDLSVVVRLSEGGRTPSGLVNPDTATLSGSENNIRAVANIIQVRSGHGVVMAGLIGERETEQASKTPILGDLPLVGTLFRSKFTAREKTEVLIFLEANVLEANPCVARAQSAENFLLGQPYVNGDVLDNPLELGMHRIGFGAYLPPGTHNEQIFWEKYHRAIRKAHTHCQDTFEP